MNLLDRVTNALDAFRAKDETQGINPLGLETKDSMRHSTHGSGSVNWSQNYSFSGWNRSIDYSSEVGSLTQSSLVMVCANWFGTTLPEAPMQVIEIDNKGNANNVPEHPMVKLLERPNPYYAGDLIWAAFALDWFVDGNVYWRKVRNNRGKVVELWPVPAFMLEPRWSKDDATIFITHYDYKVDGRAYPIEQEDIIHFRNGIDPENPRKGLAPLKSGLREIYGDMKASALSAGLMKRWGVVSHVITPKDETDTLDPTKAQAVKQLFIQETTGDNAGNPIVLGAQFEITKLGFNPKELDLAELRMIPEERIPALLQIPPIVLGQIELRPLPLIPLRKIRQ